MSMSIGGASASTAATQACAPERGQRLGAMKQLSQALEQGDVGAAKQAYVSLVRNAPEGATWDPSSHFAELGKALRGGDVPGAQAAFAGMVQNVRDQLPGTPPPQNTLPVPPVAISSTGGAAGGTLNVTA